MPRGAALCRSGAPMIIPGGLLSGAEATAAIAAGTALPLAGGWAAFATFRTGPEARPIFVSSLTDRTSLAALCGLRPPFAGLMLDRPLVAGILNVTPDSFSDGGKAYGTEAAIAQGRRLVEEGADILDIGGESTRPGAAEVSAGEQIDRVLPVIAALAGDGVPLSVDTRSATVMAAALAAGATIVNDVSALTHDPDALAVIAGSQTSVILMHSRGTPQTMLGESGYDDVLAEVYAALAERVEACLAAGIPRGRIAVDPGIGFAKTGEQNLILLRDMATFHGLGCAVMVGASRKRFIGTITAVAEPAGRIAGSLAVALHMAAQGVQILRVHDVAETRRALTLWRAVVQA